MNNAMRTNVTRFGELVQRLPVPLSNASRGPTNTSLLGVVERLQNSRAIAQSNQFNLSQHSLSNAIKVPEDPETEGFPYYPLLTVVMWVLILITLAGNFLVIASILKVPKNRKCMSNRFVLSLSAADFLVGFFVMIPSALKYQATVWNYGLTACKLWISLDIACCSISIYNLVAVSLDRCYAVYRPISYATENNTWAANLAITGAWIMGLVIAGPAHLHKPGFSNWTEMVTEQNVREACDPPVDPVSSGFVIYSSLLAFLLPGTLLAVLQAAIFVRRRKLQNQRLSNIKTQVSLMRQASVFADQSRDSNKSNKRPDFSRMASVDDDSGVSLDELSFNSKDIATLKQNGAASLENSKIVRKLQREESIQKQITTMMGVVIGAFWICWLPFLFMFLLFPHSASVADSLMEAPTSIVLITWLGYVNSSINPLIYAALNANIRRGISSLFHRSNGIDIFAKKRNPAHA